MHQPYTRTDGRTDRQTTYDSNRRVVRVQYEQFNWTRLAALTKCVFVAFAVLVPILLINMLIAMMGNTYEQIIRRSEKEWKRQVRCIYYARNIPEVLVA